MLRLVVPPVDGTSKRAHPVPTLSHAQRREIFREMAVAELRRSDLPGWRQKRLVQFAARCGLSAIEAGRLIQESRRELEQRIAAGEFDEPVPLRLVTADHGAAPQSWRLIFIGALLIALAMMLPIA